MSKLSISNDAFGAGSLLDDFRALRADRGVIWLFAFVFAYDIAAVFFHYLSGEPAWRDRTVIEGFTSSLLWMLSLTCVLMAYLQRNGRCRIFWLLSCGALAVLAIDEFLAFHERGEARGWYNDDYPKIVMWLAAALVLRAIVRMENASRMIAAAFVLGYLFHAGYILVEIGDGDVFRLPGVSRKLLKIFEEFFELMFLSCYLTAFLLLLRQRILRPRPDW